jgi:hypothetical protein
MTHLTRRVVQFQVVHSFQKAVQPVAALLPRQHWLTSLVCIVVHAACFICVAGGMSVSTGLHGTKSGSRHVVSAAGTKTGGFNPIFDPQYDSMAGWGNMV